MVLLVGFAPNRQIVPCWSCCLMPKRPWKSKTMLVGLTAKYNAKYKEQKHRISSTETRNKMNIPLVWYIISVLVRHVWHIHKKQDYPWKNPYSLFINSFTFRVCPHLPRPHHRMSVWHKDWQIGVLGLAQPETMSTYSSLMDRCFWTGARNLSKYIQVVLQGLWGRSSIEVADGLKWLHLKNTIAEQNSEKNKRYLP